MTIDTKTTDTQQISTLEVVATKNFLRDYKKLSHKQVLSPEFTEVIYLLQRNLTLPKKYKDHPLIGTWEGFRDCHIFNDLVLIYQIKENRLKLVRVSTHSNLFG